MPQLDKMTFISQITWMFLICFYFYIFLMFMKLISFMNIKKMKLNNLIAVSLFWLDLNTMTNDIFFYKKKYFLKK